LALAHLVCGGHGEGGGEGGGKLRKNWLILIAVVCDGGSAALPGVPHGVAPLAPVFGLIDEQPGR